MNLHELLLRGIYGCGFKQPLTVQQRTIELCILGHDVMIQAQSGAGKTAAIAISILQQIDRNVKDCQALILSSTGEVAQQIQKMILTLGMYMEATCHACLSDTNIHDDRKCLEAGVQIVVGTPERINDMFNQLVLRSENIKMFVLDEADEMLSRGDREQIYQAFTKLLPKVQIIVCSSTVPPDLLKMTTQFMKDPVKIVVQENNLTLDGIHQFYIPVECEKWKVDVLYDLYEMLPIEQAIIYCNTDRKVDFLLEQLRARDVSVDRLHDDMSEQERNVILREFRTGSRQILITTDFSTRTIDAQVRLIINYDLPNQWENYINRVGCSGGFRRKEVAIHIVTDDDRQKLRDIQRAYNIEIQKMPMNIADLL